jgi:hypothetical protein
VCILTNKMHKFLQNFFISLFLLVLHVSDEPLVHHQQHYPANRVTQQLDSSELCLTKKFNIIFVTINTTGFPLIKLVILVVSSQEIFPFRLLYDSICGLLMKIIGFSCCAVSAVCVIAVVPARG